MGYLQHSLNCHNAICPVKLYFYEALSLSGRPAGRETPPRFRRSGIYDNSSARVMEVIVVASHLGYSSLHIDIFLLGALCS